MLVLTQFIVLLYMTGMCIEIKYMYGCIHVVLFIYIYIYIFAIFILFNRICSNMFTPALGRFNVPIPLLDVTLSQRTPKSSVSGCSLQLCL